MQDRSGYDGQRAVVIPGSVRQETVESLTRTQQNPLHAA